MDCRIEIIEQPVSKFRFQNNNELKCYEVIEGINSTKTSKTYPTIEILGHNGPANFRVSLVAKNLDSIPHACELSGVSSLSLKESQRIAQFSHLSIIKLSKKGFQSIFEKRFVSSKDESFKSHNSDYGSISLQTVSEEDDLEHLAQNVVPYLDCVCLKFEADILNSRGEVIQSLQPVFSNPIYDIKSNRKFPLKICKLDKSSGLCTGKQEIILLCEKIQKDDISIRFFEEDNLGNLKWESFAVFNQSDIHHNYVIVFKTPPYVNTNLKSPILIKIQLVRLSDKEVSNTMDFTNLPLKEDDDDIKMNRLKSEKIYNFVNSTANKENLDIKENLNSRGNESSTLISNTSLSQNLPIKKNVVELIRRMQISLWMYAMTNNVYYLLTNFVTLMTKGNEDGDNALHLAIIHDNEDLALTILDNLQTKNYLSPINSLNHLNQSPLYLALVTNQQAVFKRLLELKADWTIIDNEANTLFHLCIINNNLDSLNILLSQLHKKPYQINQKNSEGYTALHLATMYGHLEMVRILINNEYVDIGILENRSGKSVLHMAVEGGDTAVVACLLQQCFKYVDVQMYNGNTALHLASAYKSVPIVSLLIVFGADSTIRNFNCVDQDEDTSDEEYNEDGNYSLRDDNYRNEDSIGLLPKDFCQIDSKIYKLLDKPEDVCSILRQDFDNENKPPTNQKQPEILKPDPTYPETSKKPCLVFGSIEDSQPIDEEEMEVIILTNQITAQPTVQNVADKGVVSSENKNTIDSGIFSMNVKP